MTGPAGADTWEAAPLLAWGDSSAPTPTAGASMQPGERGADPYMPVDRTLWWRVQVPGDLPNGTRVRLDTVQSDGTLVTAIVVAAGQAVNAYSGEVLAWNDQDRDSTLTDADTYLAAGQEYHVQVGLQAGSPDGNVVLRVGTLAIVSRQSGPITPDLLGLHIQDPQPPVDRRTPAAYIQWGTSVGQHPAPEVDPDPDAVLYPVVLDGFAVRDSGLAGAPPAGVVGGGSGHWFQDNPPPNNLDRLDKRTAELLWGEAFAGENDHGSATEANYLGGRWSYGTATQAVYASAGNHPATTAILPTTHGILTWHQSTGMGATALAPYAITSDRDDTLTNFRTTSDHSGWANPWNPSISGEVAPSGATGWDIEEPGRITGIRMVAAWNLPPMSMDTEEGGSGLQYEQGGEWLWWGLWNARDALGDPDYGLGALSYVELLLPGVGSQVDRPRSVGYFGTDRRRFDAKNVLVDAAWRPDPSEVMLCAPGTLPGSLEEGPPPAADGFTPIDPWVANRGGFAWRWEIPPAPHFVSPGEPAPRPSEYERTWRADGYFGFDYEYQPPVFRWNITERVTLPAVVLTTDPPWVRALQRTDGLDVGGPPRAVQHTSLRSGITS